MQALKAVILVLLLAAAVVGGIVAFKLGKHPSTILVRTFAACTRTGRAATLSPCTAMRCAVHGSPKSSDALRCAALRCAALRCAALHCTAG
jgi:hypothetical protein